MLNIRIGFPGPESLRSTTESICSSLRLNCTLIPFDNGFLYGDVDEQGIASGMLGEIQRGNFDTFQPVFTPTYARFRSIDFSDAYFYSDIVLVSRSSSSSLDGGQESFSFSVVLAFHWATWLGFVLALILVSGFISISTRMFLGELVDPCFGSSPPVAAVVESSSWSTIADRILTIFDPLPNLLTHKHHVRYSNFHYIRLLISFWSLIMIVLTGAYAGSIFSAKMKTPNKVPYKDLETFMDCLGSGQCQLVTHTSSISQMDMLTRYERVRSALAERPPLIYELHQIPQRVLSATDVHLVWMTDKLFFDLYAGNNSDCRYYVIEGFNEVWSFPMRKNESRLKRIFDRGAVAFQENALNRVEFLSSQETLLSSCKQQRPATTIRRSIADDTFSPVFRTAFCFLAGGIGLAALSFLLETRVGKDTIYYCSNKT